MRTVTQADVMAAARRLWGLPRRDWGTVMVKALGEAHAADLYRKRLGRLHPAWGNGSLAAALAIAGPLPPERFLSDALFLEATAEAIHQIIEWRGRQSVKV